MQEIAELVTTYGMATVIMIYFLYKDYKFNDSILQVLGEVKEVLTELKTRHASEVAEK